MADTQTKQAPANTPANTDAKSSNTSKRKDRTTPVRVGKVDGVPKTSKAGQWAAEVEQLRADPGSTYQWADVSQTTGSYLRKTYGVDAVTRNNRDGRADLYVTYPGKQGPDGKMVPDEDAVKEIKAQYEDK